MVLSFSGSGVSTDLPVSKGRVACTREMCITKLRSDQLPIWLTVNQETLDQKYRVISQLCLPSQ